MRRRSPTRGAACRRRRATRRTVSIASDRRGCDRTDCFRTAATVAVYGFTAELDSARVADAARAGEHDLSKLDSTEVEAFTEFTPKLAASTYGSPEYEGFRRAMGPALDHHYAKNRHHPEHFPQRTETAEVLRLDQMLISQYDVTLPPNRKNRTPERTITVERADAKNARQRDGMEQDPRGAVIEPGKRGPRRRGVRGGAGTGDSNLGLGAHKLEASLLNITFIVR